MTLYILGALALCCFAAFCEEVCEDYRRFKAGTLPRYMPASDAHHYLVR